VPACLPACLPTYLPTAQHACELLGYDFMVDEQFEVTMIEVNSNPCLEFSCKFLEEGLPLMVEEILQVSRCY
jgi:hypothetical protein